MTQKVAKKKATKKKRQKSFDVAEVRVSYGMTLNIGNYESFRTDAACVIRANVVCKTDEEADQLREDMYAEGWAIVKEQLATQVRGVRKKTRENGGEADEGTSS